MGGIRHPGYSFDLHIEKIEMAKVLIRVLVTLILLVSLLSGCADTKQTEANSNSILQKPETDHEVHGEVGVMYGHSAR